MLFLGYVTRAVTPHPLRQVPVRARCVPIQHTSYLLDRSPSRVPVKPRSAGHIVAAAPPPATIARGNAKPTSPRALGTIAAAIFSTLAVVVFWGGRQSPADLASLRAPLSRNRGAYEDIFSAALSMAINGSNQACKETKSVRAGTGLGSMKAAIMYWFQKASPVRR